MRGLPDVYRPRRSPQTNIHVSETERSQRVVRNIIDDLNSLYLVISDSPQSVVPTMSVTPSPVQRLSDSGIEPREDDEIVSISGAWLDMCDCINHGEYPLEPSQLQARIDNILNRISSSSAV